MIRATVTDSAGAKRPAKPALARQIQPGRNVSRSRHIRFNPSQEGILGHPPGEPSYDVRADPGGGRALELGSWLGDRRSYQRHSEEDFPSNARRNVDGQPRSERLC